MTNETKPSAGAFAAAQEIRENYYISARRIGPPTLAQIIDRLAVQPVERENAQLRADLEVIRSVCGDRYPDSLMLSKIHELRAELAELHEWKKGMKGVEDYLKVQFPATEGHIPLREKISKLERERDGAREALRTVTSELGRVLRERNQQRNLAEQYALLLGVKI